MGDLRDGVRRWVQSRLVIREKDSRRMLILIIRFIGSPSDTNTS